MWPLFIGSERDVFRAASGGRLARKLGQIPHAKWGKSPNRSLFRRNPDLGGPGKTLSEIIAQIGAREGKGDRRAKEAGL